LLSVALAAAQQPLVDAAVTRDSHKDMLNMINAHQHGGQAGMRAIDDLYCDGTTSKQDKKGKKAEEYHDKNNDGHCDDVDLCIDNNYGDALAEDDRPEEAMHHEEVSLLTQLSCIGDKKDIACKKVDFACSFAGRCLLNCTRPLGSKRNDWVCKDVDVCKGTHIVCMDEEGVDQWKNGKKGGNVCDDIREKKCPDFYNDQCGPNGGKKNNVYFENPNPKGGA